MYLGEFPSPPDPQNLNIDVDRLAKHQKIKFPQPGVEDVAVDGAGNIYTAVGQKNSTIYRVRPDNLTNLEVLARNEGVILGICLSPD